jgi:4-O-beta-D-mannosyl-D-glucose phosphorylase
MHVATSTISRLLDYVMNTPADGLSSANTVKALVQLIDKNQSNNLENVVLSSQINKRSK